jgi:hypothetical protein
MKRPSKKSSPNKKKLGSPLPSSLVHQLVAEEIQHLNDELLVAESILSVVTPTGQTIWGAFPILKVLQLAVDAHIRELYRVRDRLALIVDREGIELPERLRFNQQKVAP